MNPRPRPAEEALLEFFVGDWRNSGFVSPGPFGPGGPVAGETRYHWDVGGVWLIYASRMELPGLGEYTVHGGVAFNARARVYDAYAVNSLGNLLVYEGEWTGEATLVFTLIHPASESRNRVVYRKLPGGSFTMASETASEGGEFAPYFETQFVQA